MTDDNPENLNSGNRVVKKPMVYASMLMETVREDIEFLVLMKEDGHVLISIWLAPTSLTM